MIEVCNQLHSSLRGGGRVASLGYGLAVGPQHLLLLAATAASPAAPLPAPIPIEVSAPGVVLVGNVSGNARNRYLLVPDERGTVVISVERIHGLAPQALLRSAAGQRVRRADRTGKLWARPAPGTELVLELSAPTRADTSVYQLTVAFDVDRPRAARGLRRPARPRDIVRVPASDLRGLDRVTVGGLAAEHTIQGGDVFVSIPAFARAGPVELHFEGRPPELAEVELVGVEPPREDLDTGACAAAAGGAPAGCLRVAIEPSVGSLWLAAIARVVDADLVKHVVPSGVVELKLRLPSSEGFALEQLRTMPGVRSAQSMSTEQR